MPVFQGFPPWPPSEPIRDYEFGWTDVWPEEIPSVVPLFLGPPAPVPTNAGGPDDTLVSEWNSSEQFAEWQAGEL